MLRSECIHNSFHYRNPHLILCGCPYRVSNSRHYLIRRLQTRLHPINLFLISSITSSIPISSPSTPPISLSIFNVFNTPVAITILNFFRRRSLWLHACVSLHIFHIHCPHLVDLLRQPSDLTLFPLVLLLQSFFFSWNQVSKSYKLLIRFLHFAFKSFDSCIVLPTLALHTAVTDSNVLFYLADACRTSRYRQQLPSFIFQQTLINLFENFKLLRN